MEKDDALVKEIIILILECEKNNHNNLLSIKTLK